MVTRSQVEHPQSLAKRQVVVRSSDQDPPMRSPHAFATCIAVLSSMPLLLRAEQADAAARGLDSLQILRSDTYPQACYFRWPEST